MSDTGKGDGRRPGGGGGKGRSGGGDRPRSAGTRPPRPEGPKKPWSERGPAAGAPGEPRKSFGPKRFGKPEGARQPEGGGDKPFRPREDRTGSEARPFRPRPEGAAKPFAPKSRGMFSHGGREADGSAKTPRSYGRLTPETGERRPRPEPRRTTDEGAETVATMRIAKRLARAGIASRRDAEGMIADGRIRLNGKVLDTPAIDVTASDRIEIDGAPIPAIERTRLWLFHKPAGLVTTNRDPEGRPTVFDRLPDDMPRVLSVGRLDINTEGLLLLTNDGGLARILELPATGWLRRYRVRAHGEIAQEKLDELRQGIAVDGVFYGAIEASLDKSQGANVWLTLGLREGKNREVKRILSHLGLEVNRLIRLSFGPFQLGDLAEGAVQEIKGRMLRDQLGERLIAEAGADFDAPIVNPFSNKPVRAERRDEGPAKPVKRGDWISASDSKPNRKKFGAAKRDDALGRLDTKAPRGFGDRPERPDRPERRDRPERGSKPFGERPTKSFGERREAPQDGDKAKLRRPASGPKRTANVWMAPGARATGEAKKLEREAKAKRDVERPRGPRPGSDRPSRPASRPERPSRGPKT